jgi:hypothetical protein
MAHCVRIFTLIAASTLLTCEPSEPSILAGLSDFELCEVLVGQLCMDQCEMRETLYEDMYECILQCHTYTNCLEKKRSVSLSQLEDCLSCLKSESCWMPFISRSTMPPICRKIFL